MLPWEPSQQIEQVHGIFVLITYVQKPPINTDADISSGNRVQNFGLSRHLHSYFVLTAVKALVSLLISAVLSEPSVLNNGIRTKTLCAAQNVSMVRYENISTLVVRRRQCCLLFSLRFFTFLLNLANNSTSDQSVNHSI